MTLAADPIGSGLVSNLAHPGGNLTGMSALASDLAGKRGRAAAGGWPKMSDEPLARERAAHIIWLIAVSNNFLVARSSCNWTRENAGCCEMEYV
jgi:hypothetical protein